MKDIDYWKFEKESASSEISSWNNLAAQYWEIGFCGEAIRTWAYMGEAYLRLQEAYDMIAVLENEERLFNQEV
jgi:hypothetical protein